MKDRFPLLTQATMTYEQARVARGIAGTRGGDGARGQFNIDHSALKHGMVKFERLLQWRFGLELEECAAFRFWPCRHARLCFGSKQADGWWWICHAVREYKDRKSRENIPQTAAK